jgi:hypothetical protein
MFASSRLREDSVAWELYVVRAFDEGQYSLRVIRSPVIGLVRSMEMAATGHV